MKTYLNRLLFVIALFGLIGGVFGCNSSSSSRRTATFELELVNLTANQPLSPMAAILHNKDFSAWQIGTAVSNGLEQLAESGNPTEFLSEAKISIGVRDTESGTAVVLPGDADVITLTGILADARISLASMLVNTNDAFTGINNLNVSDLAVGESLIVDIRCYDAGTEANSETAATIPGPAAGGEGFNSTRNDRNFVITHPGVVSIDDGLSSSALNESHRIQNPVAQLVVTRI